MARHDTRVREDGAVHAGGDGDRSDGRAAYQGETAKMKLTERFTRISPNLLEYRFTVNDPTIWTQPWTAMLVFDKDDNQYELVEYACHEGNYAMTNILSGARVQDGSA